MKLIEQSYEIYKSQGVLKDIEIAARTCYNSQDRISENNDSAIKLVKNLVERKHYAMIEFGENIIFEVFNHEDFILSMLSLGLAHELKFINISMDGRLVISMNPRTAIEIYNKVPIDFSGFGNALLSDIEYYYGELIFNDEKISKFVTGITLFIKLNEKDLTEIEKNIHKTVTIKIITDRGISHELVRHRLCSFAQRSTRYVENKNDIQFISPPWFNKMSKFGKTLFELTLKFIEENYKDFRNIHNWQKQEARAILPNALATEILIKATLQEWKHIFDLRCATDAHPQIVNLMSDIRDDFIERKLIKI